MVLYVVYNKNEQISMKQPAAEQVVNGKKLGLVKVSGDVVEVGRDEIPHDPQLQHNHKSMETTDYQPECAVWVCLLHC